MHRADLAACLCVGELAGQATSYSPVHAASSQTTRAVSTTPAAQAARAFASPEPSPSYSPHPQPASADNSSVGLRAAELAASPVSPQAATEAAVIAMRSEAILSDGTHAWEAQTDGSSLPPLPSASYNRDLDPVPVMESPPVVESSARDVDSVPAPVSIPTPSVAVSQATTQEPQYLPLSKAEFATVKTNTPAISRLIQQTNLPVGMPPQAPIGLRPVGAFSYTVPAAATGVPSSSDRYIPAIGFSPSRARVARDPPAGPPLGHVRKQSYTVDPLPAVPQQRPTSNDALAVYEQEPFNVPAASASTMPEASMDLSRTETQLTGAVYGPGVTSTALATGTTLSSHPAVSSTTAPMPVLTETAPSVAAYTAGPSVPSTGFLQNPEWYSESPTRQLHATDVLPADAAQLPTPTQAAGVGFGPPPMLATGLGAAPFSPPVASAGPGVIPIGPTVAPTAPLYGVCVPPSSAETVFSAASVAPASAELSGTVFTAPDAANLVLTPGESTPRGLVLGGLAPGSQGIAPGPLQAGQTVAPGPVAEGTEHVLPASDLDAWSDADSVSAEPLSQTWHGRSSQPGPVCEGIETNSDVWSDSASSDPGPPLSDTQAKVGVSLRFLLFSSFPCCRSCCQCS